MRGDRWHWSPGLSTLTAPHTLTLLAGDGGKHCCRRGQTQQLAGTHPRCRRWRQKPPHRTACRAGRSSRGWRRLGGAAAASGSPASSRTGSHPGGPRSSRPQRPHSVPPAVCREQGRARFWRRRPWRLTSPGIQERHSSAPNSPSSVCSCSTLLYSLNTRLLRPTRSCGRQRGRPRQARLA